MSENKHPHSARAAEVRELKELKELKELQEEIQALRRMRSSLHAVESMVGLLKQNVQLSVKNGNTLADLNQVWNVFFTGKK